MAGFTLARALIALAALYVLLVLLSLGDRLLKKILAFAAAAAALVAAAGLAGCGTQSGGPDPAAQLAEIQRAGAAAEAAYCGLPEATRKAIRAKATKGLQVIVCPGDVIP